MRNRKRTNVITKEKNKNTSILINYYFINGNKRTLHEFKFKNFYKHVKIVNIIITLIKYNTQETKTKEKNFNLFRLFSDNFILM